MSTLTPNSKHHIIIIVAICGKHLGIFQTTSHLHTTMQPTVAAPFSNRLGVPGMARLGDLYRGSGLPTEVSDLYMVLQDFVCGLMDAVHVSERDEDP